MSHAKWRNVRCHVYLNVPLNDEIQTKMFRFRDVPWLDNYITDEHLDDKVRADTKKYWSVGDFFFLNLHANYV